MGERFNLKRVLDGAPVNEPPRSFMENTMREMDWGGGDGEGYRDWATSELKEEGHEEPSERMVHQKAVQLFREDVGRRYREFLPIFQSMRDPVRAWRSVNVPAKTIQEAVQMIRWNDVGIYWAWEESAAEPHWGGPGKTADLRAWIPKKSIDWRRTVLLNLVPNTIGDERELRLHEGARIFVEGIWFNNEWMLLNREANA